MIKSRVFWKWGTRQLKKTIPRVMNIFVKLENFGGHLLSEDDHSFWAPPDWNITKETFSLGRTEL